MKPFNISHFFMLAGLGLCFLSTVARAFIMVETQDRIYIPVQENIAKKMRTLDQEVKKQGGYIRDKAAPPLDIKIAPKATEFREVVSILQKAQENLERKNPNIAITEKLLKDEISNIFKFKENIREELVEAIKYLDVPSILLAGADRWPNQFPNKAKLLSFETIAPLFTFITIPGGSYQIGSLDTEPHHRNNEKLHEVKLNPFSIMDKAVTQEQYANIIGRNPAYLRKAEHCPDSYREISVHGEMIGICPYPVENVTWLEANEFAQLLSMIDPNYNYELATEAQWEVASRGGTNTAYLTGDTKGADFEKYFYLAPETPISLTAGNLSHVGLEKALKGLLPNAYGFFSSGVKEFVRDGYVADYERLHTGLNPFVPALNLIVTRGCYFGEYPSLEPCRSARRMEEYPRSKSETVGFRLVRAPE